MIRSEAAVTDICARIERLPYSRWHSRTLAIVGTATLFDAFDSLTIAFVLPVLAGLWKLTPSEIGFLISAGFVGQLIGAVIFSGTAERFGRLKVLTWTIWVVAIFSLASAFSWNYTSLIVFRLIQGLGLGGEVPVAASYMNEMVQSRLRGRLVILLQTSFAFGILVCALIATFMVPNFGWQSLYVLGTVPALLALFLRRLLPESPRWLATKGHIEEARATLGRIESAIIKSAGEPLAPVAATGNEVSREGPLAGESRLSALISRPYLARTVWVSIVMLCTSLTGYGLLSWMPTIYRTVYGLPVKDSLSVGLISYIAVCLGSLCLALLVDKLGRRPCFVVGFAGSAAALVALYCVAHVSHLMTVVALVSIGLFFITFLLAGGYLYAAEVYPTHIRAIGTGVASGWLRFGSIVGPTIVGLILTFGTISSVYLFFAVSALLGAAVVIGSFTETKGRVLEQTSK